ncbi:MAG: prepilin peptidase [Rhodospirillaceae bacterium]|nr:prepilin peptidase [Rhodospirillaceae bacterium]
MAGLTIGSFLNVVTYRMPIMLEHSWLKQQTTTNHDPLYTQSCAKKEKINLLWPRSFCTSCKKQIRLQDNIPILSYIALRGKCAWCSTKISLRYPVIEAITAILSMVTVWKLGPTWTSIAVLPLLWSLIALSAIDFEKQILPNQITFPLIWAGLLLSLVSIDEKPLLTNLDSSLIGATAGYLTLWIIYKIFWMFTGKEGIGYGDFKLLAALGAWLGWQSLPTILLISASSGIFMGLIGIFFFDHSRHDPIPFGPYLAMAGWIALLWEDQLIHFVWTVF